MNQQYKSGFATLIGRPNVGKSTLMNHLIGQKIAITSNKPQTTRNRIQTVYTSEEGQIVFVDTPGIHKAKNKLGEYMVTVAERTLSEVDVILWLVEPTTFIGAGEQHIAEQLRKTKTPIILVINKIDTVKREEILKSIDAYKDICDFAEIVPCSALKGDNTEDLIYEEDPRLHANAARFTSIGYGQMLALAENGAQVLHPKCVRIAMEHGIPLEVCSTFTDTAGTRVGFL